MPPEPQLVTPSQLESTSLFLGLADLVSEGERWCGGVGEEEGQGEAKRHARARQRQEALLLAVQHQPRAQTAPMRLEHGGVAPLCPSSPAILALRMSLLVQIMMPNPPPKRSPIGPGRITPPGKPPLDPAQTCHQRCCSPRCPPQVPPPAYEAVVGHEGHALVEGPLLAERLRRPRRAD